MLPASEACSGSAQSRVVSLDIFRGLTMALMIFVNDLASVHGLSRWNYHMPTKANAMSYVDMVFPAFLFIVGMAMPLAVEQRLRRNSSTLALWGHVALRSVALVVLGLVLANASGADAASMHGLPGSLWTLLALLGVLLLWGEFGAAKASRWTTAHRVVGALLLIGCYAVFRRITPEHEVGWIDFDYPEILGLIGLTYLGGAILYIPFRRSRWMPVVWLCILLVFNAGCTAHVISSPHVPRYFWPFDNGAMCSLVLAGVVAYEIFLNKQTSWSAGRRIGLGLGFAMISFAVGWLLIPLGISKNRATPTWSLWSIAACLVVFSALYWVCDVRKLREWAAPVKSAGSNTLLTYLLPDVYFYAASLFGFTAFLAHWSYGWPGVLRSVSFTGAMLLLSTLLTRAKIRMRL